MSTLPLNGISVTSQACLPQAQARSYSTKLWTVSNATASVSRVRVFSTHTLHLFSSLLGNTRHSFHTHLPVRAHIMERRHAPAARHLRICRPLQVHSWLPHATRQCRFRHHSREHRGR